MRKKRKLRAHAPARRERRRIQIPAVTASSVALNR
jgi:hypothetical protein